MEEIYIRVGRKLKEYRARRAQTQAVIAEKAGISIAFLSFLENGRKKGSLESYDKLARALGIGLDRLFRNTPANGGNRKNRKK